MSSIFYANNQCFSYKNLALFFFPVLLCSLDIVFFGSLCFVECVLWVFVSGASEQMIRNGMCYCVLLPDADKKLVKHLLNVWSTFDPKTQRYDLQLWAFQSHCGLSV